MDKFLKRCSRIEYLELELWTNFQNMETVERLMKNMKNIVVDIVSCERFKIFNDKSMWVFSEVN